MISSIIIITIIKEVQLSKCNLFIKVVKLQPKKFYFTKCLISFRFLLWALNRQLAQIVAKAVDPAVDSPGSELFLETIY